MLAYMVDAPIRTIKPHGRRQPLRPPPGPWGELRASRGLSQRQVEEISGVPRDVISRLESSRMIPRPHEAAALLEAYGVVTRVAVE